MASRRCTSPASGPLEDEDLLAEILLRLPPKPSSLPRVSLVCKRWRSLAIDAAFRRRFRIRHRKPPIVGLFGDQARGLRFMPLSDPPDRIPSERFSLDLSSVGFYSWSLLGCRHGRLLLIEREQNLLIVFEPVSRDTFRILIPPEFASDVFTFTATDGAVLCAAGDDQDHVHGDCHLSPFKVVLVSPGSHERPAIARVYSQESGMWMWGDLVSTAEPCAGHVGHSTLVGSAIYWSLSATANTAGDDQDHVQLRILKFDLDNQSLTVLSMPPTARDNSKIQIIRAEDGRLGLAILSYPSFQLWECMVDCHDVATWVQRKDINMDEMLGPKVDSAELVGYAEDAHVIFMLVYKDSDSPGLTTVQLESMMVKECHGGFYADFYHPLTNFYTAGTARA